MPREDRELQKKTALVMFKQGKKLVDIAQELGVPQGTVRRWKSEQGWEDANVRKNKPNVRKGTSREEKFLDRQEEKADSKRDLFCIYYVKYRNQVKAYQKAYGCSYENACSHASTLMKNEEVKERIKELKEKLYSNLDFDLRDLARQQYAQATADYADFVYQRKDGSIELRNLDNIDGTIIKEIRNTKYGPQVILKDSQKAIEWLTRFSQAADDKQDADKNAGVALIQAKLPKEEPPEDDE